MPPVQRTRHLLEFPELPPRGIFVIELIGGQESSRAVVRRGQLRLVERVTAGGHAMRVLDGTNRAVSGASILLGAHEYRAEQGTEDIMIPFSHQSTSSRDVILCSPEGFCSLASFEHQKEVYAFEAAFFVDYEALIAGQRAQVVAKASLEVCKQSSALDVLGEATMTILAVDSEGVSSTKVCPGLRLSMAEECVQSFTVPQGLVSLSVELTTSVAVLSEGGSRRTLSASWRTKVASQKQSLQIAHPHLVQTAAGYQVKVMGANGEPVPSHDVQLQLKQELLTTPESFTMSTGSIPSSASPCIPLQSLFSCDARALLNVVFYAQHPILMVLLVLLQMLTVCATWGPSPTSPPSASMALFPNPCPAPRSTSPR